PEQGSYIANSVNKDENLYLQDDIPITDSVDLQKNPLVQNKKNRSLSSLMAIDNNKIRTFYLTQY
ncbi:6854_t:CDS:1, partial [Cetraspora pellucida]